MYRNKPSNIGQQHSGDRSQLTAGRPTPTASPEHQHRACWYGRRTDVLPTDLARHTTIEDGQLLFCAHPMWFPIVGYQFDVRNCARCEYYKPVRTHWG
jgi:hypothetical protein